MKYVKAHKQNNHNKINLNPLNTIKFKKIVIKVSKFTIKTPMPDKQNNHQADLIKIFLHSNSK